MSTAIAASSAAPALKKTSPVQATPAVRGDQVPLQDGDTGAGAAAIPASAPKPVINSLGQLLGSRLNVKA